MSAVKQALESPLLDSSSIKGTKDILLNIISGTEEITMGEIGEIIDYLQDAAGQDATIIWGNGIDLRLEDEISVTIIATGFDVNPNRVFQHPTDVVELIMKDEGLDINLGDESPNGLTEVEPIVINAAKKEPIPQSKEELNGKRRSKKKDTANGVATDGDTDSWFTRQFTRFFEDNSTGADQMQ
jgi:cell division protein FtsZ